MRCGRSLVLFLLPAAWGQSIVATRILRGSGSDRASFIATDPKGFVYIAGTTTSSDFPVTNAFQPRLHEPALRFSADRQNFVPANLPEPRVLSISASPDAQVLIAATPAGVFRSTDSGATWSLANSGLPSLAEAVAMDPTNSSNAYAVAVDGRIFRTTNGGASWQAGAITLRNFPSSIVGAQIAVHLAHPSTIFALTGNSSQFFRSDDAGVSWQRVVIPAPRNFNGEFNPSSFAIAHSDSNVIYASGDGPLHKSVDGGATWAEAAFIGAAQLGGLTVDPRDANVVWLVNGRGVFKSVDGGASFTPSGLGDHQFLHLIAVDSADSSRVFSSDYSDVYESTDGGGSWQRVAGGLVEAIYPASTGVYLAGDVQPTIFAAKLDPTLTQLVYSTYLGPGANLFNPITAMTVDRDGNLYLAGNTQSHDFPVTDSAFDRSFASTAAAFVTKLSADGASLLYSTLLDGVVINGLALDAGGNAVIVGTAARGKLPLTEGALESAPPEVCTRVTPPLSYPLSIPTGAFVSKLNADASALIFSTYLSGSCGDTANAVTVDASGSVYVAGETYSDDFPVTPGAMTTKFPGTVTSGFISKLSAAGDLLEYSSFFGGGFYTSAHAIALDTSGAVVLAGNTQAKASPGAFQRPQGLGCPPIFGLVPIQPAPVAADDAFAMKLNLSASDPVFLATFGGSCQDSVTSMSLDATGNIWMTGSTTSADFSTRAPIAGLGEANSQGAFLARLSADGSDLPFAEIVGGGAVTVGQGSDVFYAGGFVEAGKTSQNLNPAYSVQIARLDGSAIPAIALDRVTSFNGSQGNPPYSTPSPVAPGQMIRLRGRGIGPMAKTEARFAADGRLDTNIGGVQVLFDGVAAPMVTAQDGEIVCLTPFELDGKASTSVQVWFAGKRSNAYGIGVVAQSPDYVAIANADGSANSPSNPAALGSTVALYVTGLGQTNPPGVDGSITRDPGVRPLKQPSISAFSIPQVPSFFGAAPGEVAGITQINLGVVDPGASNNLPVYVGSAFGRIYVAKPQ
jgi:uncharacterized protein (TIGR03437 family)